ncbi:MAG: hypothetical protein LBD22_04075, partial [Spirochaetaceae bacterium]|nr:hypothetical protein [Spirochaetaceae bacterium]
MKLRYLLGTLIFCCTQYAYTDSAETKPFKFRDHFHFKQLFTGSWNNKDQIGYSAISTLSGPFDLAVRGQFTGFQPRPLWEDFYAGRIDAGAGIYHQRTGTRLLAGKLETWGLATRTRTVWIHALPWFEVHKPSGADLRTVYVASAPESIYLNLISPEFDLSRITSHFSFPLVVSLQNAALFNEENYFFLQGSSTAQIAKHHKFRFEWCYTEKSLPERRQSTWFSEKRYLPVREIRFYAFNLMYAHPWVGFSTDFACSEIFAWGEDFYLNGGVRIGKRPWRLSFAADGAGMY